MLIFLNVTSFDLAETDATYYNYQGMFQKRNETQFLAITFNWFWSI